MFFPLFKYRRRFTANLWNAFLRSVSAERKGLSTALIRTFNSFSLATGSSTLLEEFRSEPHCSDQESTRHSLLLSGSCRPTDLVKRKANARYADQLSGARCVQKKLLDTVLCLRAAPLKRGRSQYPAAYHYVESLPARRQGASGEVVQAV